MDKRISAVKTASLILFAAFALAFQAFTNHRHLTDEFDRIRRDLITYVLMTTDRESGIELQMDTAWAARVSEERMRRVQEGSDIEFPTGPIALSIGEFPFASDFAIQGTGPLPDGRAFHFSRLKPGSARDRYANHWKAAMAEVGDSVDESMEVEVFAAWPVDDLSKRFTVVFPRYAPHGDSFVPVNASEEGIPVRAAILGDDPEPLTASTLRSRIVFAARDFAVSATDPAEAYRQADLQLRKERIRVPVLNLETGYLPALAFLLVITTASLLAVSSNLRQMALAGGSRTEPWMVLERTPATAGTPRFARALNRLETGVAVATFAAALVSGVAAGVLVCVAVREASGLGVGFWSAAAVTLVLVLAAVSCVASLVSLLRGVRNAS